MREVCIDPENPQFGPSTTYDAPAHFVRVDTPQFRQLARAAGDCDPDEYERRGVSHRTRGDGYDG